MWDALGCDLGKSKGGDESHDGGECDGEVHFCGIVDFL
jgi:hypothetical protein